MSTTDPDFIFQSTQYVHRPPHTARQLRTRKFYVLPEDIVSDNFRHGACFTFQIIYIFENKFVFTKNNQKAKRQESLVATITLLHIAKCSGSK